MEEVTRKLKVFNIEDGGSFCRINEKTRSLDESSVGTSTEANDMRRFNFLKAYVKWSFLVERAARSSLRKQKKLNTVLKKQEMKKKKKKTKTKKSRNKIIDLETSPRRISRNLERKIEEKGGRDIKLVAMKQLSSNDLNKHQSFVIPGRRIRSKRDDYFLSEEEERSVSKMDVMMMEPCGKESRMAIVKCEVGNSYFYALRRGWNGLMQRNREHFNVNDLIQVWSFRVDTQLWFAIDRHLRNDLCLGMDRLSLY